MRHNAIVIVVTVAVILSLLYTKQCQSYHITSSNNLKGRNIHTLYSMKKLLSSFIVSTTILTTSDVLIANAATDAAPTTTTTTALAPASGKIPVQPLFTKKTNDLQAYSDIGRGFKMQRPFGFNEFDGAGTGYAVKFASLFDIDEAVIVGSVPASAGKESIVAYGSVESIGEKLAAKRKGKLITYNAHVTDGITFYYFEFENPLDPQLPRTGPKNARPTSGVELYQLCVSKGRLWSVSATSNDRLFIASEIKLRNSVASFIPHL